MDALGLRWRRFLFITLLCIVIVVLFFAQTTNIAPLRLLAFVSSHGSVSLARPPCTFDIFKQYVNNRTYFPNKTSWVWQNGIPVYFQPEMCEFKYKDQLPGDYLLQGLLRKNISKILMLGDSQGARFMKALKSILQDEQVGLKCLLTKQEKRPIPDRSYYLKEPTISLARLKSHRRDCVTCISVLVNCTKVFDNQNVTAIKLRLEYLSMEHYADTELTTMKAEECQSGTCPFSQTTQEFYFTEYLSENHPDIIILFGNNHFFKFSLERNKSNIQSFTKLLETVIPKTTKIVWITTPAELEEKKAKRHRNRKFDKGKYTSREYLRLENQLLFDTLKPMIIEKHSNFLPFLDLASASIDVLPVLNTDGVHFKPAWYKLIMGYLLQTLCNSDL